ncbi:PTS sugar transporter subunit IIA [uncultured Dubosiella sp.]|uniref:PTS sugar transporter subunit IIA n=1 Tax=uncultured Dubosiella sp. TaxID=1937011 RepID=UPI00272F6BEE|nr:PTS sugar transporter subunit IIA [uncultured Dubosiella sp.]
MFANVDPALDWPALVAEAGLLADGSASEVTSALLEREKIGSVMVPELGFGLLHAKTTGVKNAQVQFLWPAQAQEFAAYPGIRAVVVLLMPADYASYHQKLLSSVTTYMMETTNLQQAVFEREERRIQQALSAIYLELIRADMA